MAGITAPDDIGEKVEVQINPRIRKSLKDMFSDDPLTVVKEAINNIVEDSIEKNRKDTKIVIRYITDKSIPGYELGGGILVFQDNGSGVDMDRFLDYGNSQKSSTLGRYGQGFKDTALAIGQCVLIRTPVGSWKLSEDKANEKLFINATRHVKIKEGTVFTIPLKKGIKFEYGVNGNTYHGEEAIAEYVKDFAALALYKGNISIRVNRKGLSRKFPGSRNIMIRNIHKTETAWGVVASTGSGVVFYSQGGYRLDKKAIDTVGEVHLNVPVFAEKDGLIMTDKRVNVASPIYRRHIEPNVKKWIKRNKLAGSGMSDFGKELKTMCRLFAGLNNTGTINVTPLQFGVPSGKKSGGKPSGAYAKSGKYKGQSLANLPDMAEIDEPHSWIFVNVGVNTMTFNIAHPLYKMLGELPRSRRWFFLLPLVSDRMMYIASEPEILENVREDWEKVDFNMAKSLPRVTRIK